MPTRRFDRYKSVLRRLWLPLTFTVLLPVCSAQENTTTQPVSTTREIVDTMVSQNEARAKALEGYVGRRIYGLHYRGFPGDRSAQMVVDVRYIAPGTKQFTVVSESGSKFILDHVLKRLLSGEQDAQDSKNSRALALTPQNYRFAFVGQESAGGRRLYVLSVKPKVENKFAYRGKIWIDGTDFAVVRIEAEPAKNPSFWISHTHIEEKYARFGAFWLPVENISTSKIRMLHGTAILKIEYRRYSVEGSFGASGASMATVTQARAASADNVPLE